VIEKHDVFILISSCAPTHQIIFYYLFDPLLIYTPPLGSPMSPSSSPPDSPTPRRHIHSIGLDSSLRLRRPALRPLPSRRKDPEAYKQAKKRKDQHHKEIARAEEGVQESQRREHVCTEVLGRLEEEGVSFGDLVVYVSNHGGFHHVTVTRVEKRLMHGCWNVWRRSLEMRGGQQPKTGFCRCKERKLAVNLGWGSHCPISV